LGYQPRFATEEYDRQFNRLYVSIPVSKKSGNLFKSVVQESSAVQNIAIYDILSRRTRYLFEEVVAESVISHLLFEESFDSKSGWMAFNRSSSHIQNNEAIPEREPANRLFVCQHLPVSKKRLLWTFQKDGDGKRLVAEMEEHTDWFLDVFNQKIRLIKRQEGKVEIQDFDW
jgi:hypothetical protein